MSDSVWPHRRQPTRLPCPWDSPGKTTGVGCHFLSNAWKWKVKGKLLSRVRLFTTSWTAAHQAPLSMGFSRQEYWSGVPSLLRTASLKYDKVNISLSLQIQSHWWLLLDILLFDFKWGNIEISNSKDFSDEVKEKKKSMPQKSKWSIP